MLDDLFPYLLPSKGYNYEKWEFVHIYTWKYVRDQHKGSSDKGIHYIYVHVTAGNMKCPCKVCLYNQSHSSHLYSNL